MAEPLPSDFLDRFDEHFNCWNRGELDLMLDWVIDQRMSAKGARSGIAIGQRFAMRYTIRAEDDKIVDARLLPDVATALAAAESSSATA